MASVDDLADALESSPFNFTLDDDPGNYNSNTTAEHDATSGVYYHAWILRESTDTDDKEIAQIGVQVTAENAKQNRFALRNAPVYVIRVAVDKKNKN